MTSNAGERLFEAIGQLPDEMVAEAEQSTEEYQKIKRSEKAAAQSGLKGLAPENLHTPIRKKAVWAGRISGYLKYLPVAACLCMVFGGAGYMVSSYFQSDKSESISVSGSMDGGFSEETVRDDQDVAVNDAKPAEESGSMAEGAQQFSGGTSGQKQADRKQEAQEKVLEGPVFPLTATGDTQKLKVSRSLKGTIVTEGEGNDRWPLLEVADVYRIKNMSQKEKTLQLVYPFVTTLNQALSLEGGILNVQGIEQTGVSYGIGESIRALCGTDGQDIEALMEAPIETPVEISMEDYVRIFDGQTDYQEQALAKEADWSQEVRVYTFSDFQMQEGAAQSGVVGVTVESENAQVLTYGFDHSFETDDGTKSFCFFFPQEQKKRMLLIVGDSDAEPELGYYTNLDCVERAEGMQCEMEMRSMSYADALRLCGNEATRKLQQDHENGMYADALPEYMNADAAFRALTMISEEEDFYHTLLQRYQSTELAEVFERLFGETRVVYALMTVTIPSKQTVRVSARTQKRQPGVKDIAADGEAADNGYRYDFFSSAQSRLQIKKTAMRLGLSGEWKLADENIGLEQKRGDVWKGELRAGNYYFCLESGTFQNKD